MKLKAGLIILCAMIFSSLTYGQLLNVSLRKTDIDEVYEQARKLADAGKYSEALPYAKKAADEFPKNPDYNLLLGKIYIHINKPQLARPYIVRTLSANSNYKDAYLLAINMELASGNTNQAIAYANRALIKYPNDLDFSIKKLAVFDQAQNFPAGDAVALNILENYPNNAKAKNAWTGHFEAAGNYYKSKGMMDQAQRAFAEAMKIAPNNAEVSNQFTTISMRTLTPQEALQQVNNALVTQPRNYDLLMKKLGLLQDMHEYSDANKVLRDLTTYYPGDAKVRSLNLELKMEASQYYEHTDPYVLYQSVLDVNPGNQEALNKLISISMDRGVYRNALDWINKGLTSRPDDFELLSKKADVLEILGNKTGASEIIFNLWLRNPDSEPLRERAAELKIAAGKYYVSEKMYDKALTEFEDALNIKPSEIDAVTNIANIYIEQKDYESALSAIDVALQYKEDDEQLLLKKASVLADAGRYNEAFPVIGKLIEMHPDNKKYGAILTEQQLKAGRLLMNAQEAQQAVVQFKNVLNVNPSNEDALKYVINLESGMGRYDSALYYVNTALNYYPNDKDFLLKKISVLSSQNKNREAYMIADELRKEYPYSKVFKDAYIDNVIASGYAYQKQEKWNEALAEFQKVLNLSPYDTSALYAAVNLNNATNQPDKALALIEKGLNYYENNNFLLRQKAITYEALGEYQEAVAAADQLYKNTQMNKDFEYLNYLRGKMFRNQFGVFYEQTTFTSNSSSFRILSMEYRRLAKKWDVGFRLNFGTKQSGFAVQAEADAYYKHTADIYSHLNVAGASSKEVFPQLRATYSITKEWKGDFATEIGVNAMQLQTQMDSIAYFLGEEQYYSIRQGSTMVTGILGLSKSFGDFWFEAKGYFMFDYPEQFRTITYFDETTSEPYLDYRRFFQAYKGTIRFHMNNRQEYVYMVGGLGTSPDDRGRVIQIPELSGTWLNQYVSAGYQKTFNYKTVLNGSIGWNNYKSNINTFISQYHISLSLIRKF